MTKYSNYKKAVKLTPTVAETLYAIIASTPELAKLTGAQRAAVAELMYAQKEYGYNECGREFGLWKYGH